MGQENSTNNDHLKPLFSALQSLEFKKDSLDKAKFIINARLPSQDVNVDTVGKIVEVRGTIIKVTGVNAAIGDQCLIRDNIHKVQVLAEVVGLEGDYVLLTPLSDLRGISTEAQVRLIQGASELRVGDGLLGRVIDANVVPIDGLGGIRVTAAVPLFMQPPNPMQRPVLNKVLPTGVRAIDSMLSVAQGQRMGIFAVAGAGKSSLLGMLARGSSADVNVIALIGERGREVKEFIEQCLGAEGMSKSVVVVATSDRSALERMRAAFAATAIAEYFRSRGKQVLLLCDSVTRFARACRDVGLAAGELPTRRGFPPSVFGMLPSLFERTGADENGSITAFYTVLVEDEDTADPIAEEVRSLLDGHIELSRKLAGEGHFPAIDILSSISRLMSRIIEPSHAVSATQLRKLLAKYREVELLIQMGEYKKGNDATADHAIRVWLKLNEFLTQPQYEKYKFTDSLATMQKAMQ
jgi:ATP synthase in type III secretion protein N